MSGFSGIPGLGALPPADASAAPATANSAIDVQMADDSVPPLAAPSTSTHLNDRMDTTTEASITSALEAMLDDYEPMPALEAPIAQPLRQNPTAALATSAFTASPASQAAATNNNADDTMDVSQEPAQATSETAQTTQPSLTANAAPVAVDTDMTTDAPTATDVVIKTEPQADNEGAENADPHPEWEVDSSPYESSSDSSSDSDSDDDSEDEKYELLGIEETARILMKAEGDSDDEGENSGKTAKQLRTKNEIDEQYAPRPDVVITPEMKIEPLGLVEHVVDNTIVVRGFTPAEYQVLDSGSVLCLEDRRVVGSISEPLGKVQQPMYLVGFQRQDEIQELGLTAGLKLYYSVAHANYVFTSALKNLKGSDASNIHDEEVNADEAEFSDDEKEAEHKRMKKQKRREKNNKNGEPSSSSGLRNEVKQETQKKQDGLDYGGEGSYRRLTRPPGFGTGQSSNPTAAPTYQPPHSDDTKPRDLRASGTRGRGGAGTGHRGGASRGGARGPQGSWEPSYAQPPAHSPVYAAQPQHAQPPAYNAPAAAYQPPPAPYTQPSVSAPFYAPQAPATGVPGIPGLPGFTAPAGGAGNSPFGNGVSPFGQFPIPPPPNADPTSIPPLPQFVAAAAALAAAGVQLPVMPGLVPPPPAGPMAPQQQQVHQQHQQQQQQQQQVAAFAAAAALNPGLLQLVMQQAAQNPNFQHQGPGGRQ
ncbi:hypothetical protein BROUX41_005863 [Berkeleyomyces rouxiae]|uniref:uncharacterized protein n=1 Tax=Berkeleyomyces rouxiae TaxID=2035830 RepID=UPI003B7D2987